MSMLETQTVAFIGAGHITGILLDNLLGNGVLQPSQVIVSSRGPANLQKLAQRFDVATMQDNVAAGQAADLIVVAVRPDVVPTVVDDLVRATLKPEQLVLSLAAGTPFRRFGALPAGHPIIRAMPNPPSRIGQGLIAYCCSPTVTPEQKAVVLSLLDPLGKVIEVIEEQMALITALTSPVTTLYFLEALVAAGENGGLDTETATEIAAQTILGSIGVWQASDETPAALINEASTPGGISVESTHMLRELAVSDSIMAAIKAGADRARALAAAD